MRGCSEKVLIQGIVPFIPRGSWILMSLSSSSVPRMPILISIQKDHITSSIYIHKKVRKGLDENIDQATHYH